MNKYVLGRPGSGKTRYLLERVEEALSAGVSPQRVGLLSFTRAAVTEAAERAARKFDYKAKDFENFKTLHAMAFSLLGLRRSQVLLGKHAEDFKRQTGYDVAGVSSREGILQDSLGAVTIHYHNLSRATGRAVPDLLRDFPSPLASAVRVEEFARVYRKFKAQRSLVDFQDMLELVVTETPFRYPQLDLLLVDETQDLSPLQWTMVDQMSERANEVHLVGDPNQSIYCWAGADPSRLLKSDIAMPFGYRMGRAIHAFAEKVEKKIKARATGSFVPAESVSPGKVEKRPSIHSMVDAIRRGGDWLVLARTNHLLSQAKAVVGKVPERVEFDTYHGSKGREADNVVVLNGMTPRCVDTFMKRPDDEWRAFYVACTRAKNALYLVDAGTELCYNV